MKSPTALLVLLVAAGCAGGPATPLLDGGPVDAGPAQDAGQDGGAGAGTADKASACASTFGSALTDAFGRVDGTVVAVVSPGVQCPLPNSDHVVVQVRFGGDVYRMVINVQSDFGDPQIRHRSTTAPLPAPVFAEGWHPGLSLDYVNDLGVHSGSGWEALSLEAAAARVYDAVEVGAPVSVYGTSSGGTYADTAHKIHRNTSGGVDGALVLNPTSGQPTWLLFHFANQTF